MLTLPERPIGETSFEPLSGLGAMMRAAGLDPAAAGSLEMMSLPVASDLVNAWSEGGDEPVAVRILARPGAEAEVLAALRAMGMDVLGTQGAVINGMLPVAAIPELLTIDGMVGARRELAGTNAGSVTSQGVQALGVDVFAETFRTDGTGITVGVISDSFDIADGALAPPLPFTTFAEDVASGDLPADVDILQEGDPSFASDEGRALAQIVADVAPGAGIAFHTAFPGVSTYVDAVEALAEVSDVIVDDVFFLTEPFFQDGLAAQAADAAAAAGIPYFSSAGNSGNRSYEADYDAVAFSDQAVTDQLGNVFLDLGDGSSIPITAFYQSYHDFDPGPGVDLRQGITLQPGQTLALAFQWADPFLSAGGPGADANLDFYLLFGDAVVDAGLSGNAGGDAVELSSVVLTNPFDDPITIDFVVGSFVGGNDPERIKYNEINVTTVDLADPAAVEFATASGTSFGQASAEGAFGVGAAPYILTERFGFGVNVLEDFSSSGTTPILFEPDGTPTFEDRQRVDGVGPDANDTTFFGTQDLEPNGLPNFFGTSASAPHVAALAALVLEIHPELEPEAIYDAFRDTADPVPARISNDGSQIVAAGPEFTGGGLVNVDAALRQLVNVIDGTEASNSLRGTGEVDVLLGLGGNDLMRGNGSGDRLIGEEGSDRLYGNGGDDDLFGGEGNDLLLGGSGNDWLVGDGGRNTLFGNSGADHFVLNDATASNRISDFQQGTDTIFVAEELGTGILEVAGTQGGTNLFFDGQLVAQVAGVSDLDETDFEIESDEIQLQFDFDVT